MPAKRRSSGDNSNEPKKAPKTHARVVISQSIEEPLKEPVVQKTAAPMSAIAARRAAIQAGIYKPAPEPEEEEEEEEVQLDDPEGIEVQSVGDEEEEELIDEDRVMSPISGAATPVEKSIPFVNENVKLKNKMPQYMDYQSVSQFISTANNTCVINQEDDTYMFLGLKSGEHIFFMGQVMVAPLFGSISVAGAVLSSGRQIPKDKKPTDLDVSFYPVFSPRTHSLLSINTQPFDAPSCTLHDNTIEIDSNLIEAVFEELANDMDQFESVLVLKDLEGSGLDNIRDAVNCFTKPLIKFTKKEMEQDKKLKINYFPRFQPILQPTPGVKGFHVDSSWEVRTTLAMENASKRESPLVSVVCGAKDMGKSSYSRYLVNRLLTKYNRVAYIETDVGQSEFTPSGLISLHYITQPLLGPAYTHQQLEPERSFFFGSTSPRSNLDYYLDCIYELMDHWKRDQEQVRDEEEREWIPLVVNTLGWVSGVGYNLLISQIQKIEPTDIFAMRHHMLEYKNLPPTFNMDIVPVSREAFVVAKEAPVLHYLGCVLQHEGAMTLADNFTAAQQREITLGTYFHQSSMGVKHQLSPHWDFQKHMIDRVPWVVDWRKTLNAVWVIYEEVKLNELFYTLNGSLVGLIGDVKDYKHQKGPNHAITNDTFTPPKYFNTEDQPLPSPRDITCHGLAIVRAVDPSRHALLLLTPVPKSTLEKVSAIMKGEMKLPLWSMLDQRLEKASGVADVPWKKVPYISKESVEGAGATALRVRRNLLRRSQQA